MRPTRTFSFFYLCLLVVAALAACVGPAAAQQQQQKRIALVVGNGSYANAPLATAANDAGLIAQTLQAAGFDVIGARDLDGDTLRKSFRDFIQKAESSGADTVAMVYLAGYGVQLAGENYFIPVDSAITHDTDIPVESLRISDYTRQLAALPLKASVIVLDAARQQPFIEGAQIASGLALVEPENNMLIAFNAAPGTVAPSETGPYGIYAQSLAEMIRTGGLSLPDLFDRVRLRVNEASKGAQVPWHTHKIQVQFSFFERTPDAPPTQGPDDQVAAIRDRPIRDLSAQDAYAAALQRDTLQGYEDFLAAYPDDPLASRVRAINAARREAITWRRTYQADTPEAYWSYLQRYPHGPHAFDARRRLAILGAPLEPPPSFALIDYDVPPPPPDEITHVDRPVLYLGDPDFGFASPPPPPEYILPPPPPDFSDLPPPFAPPGLFILPQPAFVPIPVFYRPPVYVAPPPDNVIFNNIHNTAVINNVINRPPAPAAAPGTPQAAAAAAAGRPVGAAPPVPRSVQQQASLIHQGKAPVPHSALVNPAARPGSPGATPANVTPNALPQQPALPRTNALPVPGAPGAPPPPRGSPGAGPVRPDARLTSPPMPSPPGAGRAGVNPNAKLAPHQPPSGAAQPSPPARTPSAKLTPPTPGPAAQRHAPPARPMAPAAAKPAAKLSPPAPHAAPSAPHAPPRPAPPPPVAHAARPAPPAPHPAPPPRPPVARPAPPPVAHAAPPPPPRPAPPRPAPPRPAAPAAAKRCPPNQRC